LGWDLAGDAPVWVRIDVEDLTTSASESGSTLPRRLAAVAMKDHCYAGIESKHRPGHWKINAGPGG